MEPINIMVSGFPEKMAAELAEGAIEDPRFQLIPYGLAEPDIEVGEIVINNHTINLIKWENGKEKLSRVLKDFEPFIATDFTHPDIVDQHVRFYIENRIPFVMGTSEAHRRKLTQALKNKDIQAVVSSNMSKPAAGLQAMMTHLANNYPGLYKGYRLIVNEGGQSENTDIQKMQNDMADNLHKMGVRSCRREVLIEESPGMQGRESKVLEQFFNSHDKCAYRLEAEDGSVLFEFKYNINRGEIYRQGTFDAVIFLHNKLKNPENRGKVYTMTDVLT